MSHGTTSFSATRWTLVQRSCGADPEARLALSDLCGAYYAPVVAFLRRDGRPEDAARELAHAFFARLLEGGAINGADPGRGRFRNYLLGALKNFACAERERACAAKRGGDRDAVSLDDEHGETAAGLQIADPQAESPDTAFDRQWALTVLARALDVLEKEMAASGKAEQFTVLKPWLTGDAQNVRQADAAAALGMSENSVKVAIHRLRKRFREAVKEEIAHTVGDPAQVQEEMDSLIAALR
jgi:RNA polymerase sigma-70 factor (ECF subfamily)